MQDTNWKLLSGKGWPQLQECTWLALEALEEIDNQRAQRALAAIRQVLTEGAFDPATRPSQYPPPELVRLSEDDTANLPRFVGFAGGCGGGGGTAVPGPYPGGPGSTASIPKRQD